MLATLNMMELEATAMVVILDKENKPIAIKNYLAESNTYLDNQMIMLVYQALDVVDQ